MNKLLSNSSEAQFTAEFNDWAKILDKETSIDKFTLNVENVLDTYLQRIIKCKLLGGCGIGETVDKNIYH